MNLHDIRIAYQNLIYTKKPLQLEVLGKVQMKVTIVPGESEKNARHLKGYCSLNI